LHLSGLILALTTLLAALARLLCLLPGLVLLTLLTALSGLVTLLVLLTLIILIRHERFLSGVRRKYQPVRNFFVPAHESINTPIGGRTHVGFLQCSKQPTVCSSQNAALLGYLMDHRLCPCQRMLHI
jgi:hypothetical protein